MNGSDTFLLDTNILLYSSDPASPYHPKAKNLLDRAAAGKFQTVLAAQNIFEFYSVVTNKKRAASPLSQKEANDFIRKILDLTTARIIYLDRKAFAKVKSFLENKQIKDRQIFDAALVATMAANGVRRLFTLNTADFRQFSKEVQAINPFS